MINPRLLITSSFFPSISSLIFLLILLLNILHLYFIDYRRLQHANLSLLVIFGTPELIVAITVLPVPPLEPHHLMLFIVEIMVPIPPIKDVHQKAAKKNYRNQACDDDAYDGQALFAQDVVFFLSFVNVDLLDHVDEGQDDCESLKDGADFSQGDLARAAHTLTNVGENCYQGHHQGSHVEHLLAAEGHVLVKNAHIDRTNEQQLQNDKRRHTVWGLVHGQNEVGILVGVNFLLRLVFFLCFLLYLLFFCKFW